MSSKRKIKLNAHDESIANLVLTVIHNAVENAHAPAAVAKRIAVVAVRYRNRGRVAARRRHPFSGICEQSGERLERQDAVLDELEPTRGFDGRVRWVCPKANNSGMRSCGRC
jgi:hypothetical protein